GEVGTDASGLAARGLDALLRLPAPGTRLLRSCLRGTQRAPFLLQYSSKRIPPLRGRPRLLPQAFELGLEPALALGLQRCNVPPDLRDPVGCRLRLRRRCVRVRGLLDQRQLATAPLGVLGRALAGVPRALEPQRDPLAGRTRPVQPRRQSLARS